MRNYIFLFFFASQFIDSFAAGISASWILICSFYPRVNRQLLIEEQWIELDQRIDKLDQGLVVDEYRILLKFHSDLEPKFVFIAN